MRRRSSKSNWWQPAFLRRAKPKASGSTCDTSQPPLSTPLRLHLLLHLRYLLQHNLHLPHPLLCHLLLNEILCRRRDSSSPLDIVRTTPRVTGMISHDWTNALHQADTSSSPTPWFKGTDSPSFLWDKFLR